ncbi:unnamed protein product [Chrysodeixis includens]|uniref:Uncharacterized protein n=1 Tax=Chrysodeixis includens TaxID=689277 RepID=A0A9N8L5Z0_CHRIL|nr:unnamed protein product [Chrysodeixis includens]
MASKLIVLLSLAVLGCTLAAPVDQPADAAKAGDEEVPVLEVIEVDEEIPAVVGLIDAASAESDNKEPAHSVAKRSALRGDNPSNDLLANYDGLLIDNSQFGLDGRRIKFLPTWVANIKDLIWQVTDPNDKLQVDFLNRAKMSSGMKLDFIINNPKVTTIDRKNDVSMQIQEHYTENNGKPLINIVEECFKTYFLSYIARTGFPFYENVREFIERLHGAGLPTMYYIWTQRMLGIPESTYKYRQEPRPFAETSLSNLRISYAILFCGYLMSTILFVIELWKGKRDRTKKEKVVKRKPGRRNVRGAC